MALRAWRHTGSAMVVRKGGTTDPKELIRVRVVETDPITGKALLEIQAHPDWIIYREELPKGEFRTQQAEGEYHE